MPDIQATPSLFVTVKCLLIIQSLLLLFFSTTSRAEIVEVDGPYTIVSPFLLRPGDPQAWWKSTFYNPSGIRATGAGQDKLLLFVQVLDNFEVADTGAYERCVGDSVVLFEQDWDFQRLRDPFTLVSRVSPCSCLALDGCPPDVWVYGLGSVLRSQYDDKYYLFLDKARRGVDLLVGDFKEVILMSSVDGEAWDQNAVETFLRQSFVGSGSEQREISVYDATLVSEVDRWWGVFRWSSRKHFLPEGSQEVQSGSGLVRVFPHAGGRVVEFYSGGGWLVDCNT